MTEHKADVTLTEEQQVSASYVIPERKLYPLLPVPVTSLEISSDARCYFCYSGFEQSDQVACCGKCGTPYHLECWLWFGAKIGATVVPCPTCGAPHWVSPEQLDQGEYGLTQPQEFSFEVPTPQNFSIFIGSAEDNHWVLPAAALENIKPYHAILTSTASGQFVIISCGGRVAVNDEEIVLLKRIEPGDQLMIGPATYRFLVDSATNTASSSWTHKITLQKNRLTESNFYRHLLMIMDEMLDEDKITYLLFYFGIDNKSMGNKKSRIIQLIQGCQSRNCLEQLLSTLFEITPSERIDL